jgi:phosphate transport system permease protein
MAAAKQRIGRLKRIDRAAVFVITLGGIAVVVAVMGILVFVAAEALPLFTSARLTSIGDVRVPIDLQPDRAGQMRAVGIDEYRMYVYAVEPAGRVVFHRYESGDLASEVPVPGLGSATVTSSSRSVKGHFVAAGLSDGRVSLMQVRYLPQYEGEVLRDLTIEVVDRGTVALDDTGRAVRQVTYLEQDEEKFVAGLTADDEVAYWWAGSDGAEHRTSLKVDAPDRVTHIRLGRNGSLLAGTDHGRVYHWVLMPELRRADISQVSPEAITALEWMLGGNSWVAAAADGTISGWLNAPVGTGNEAAMVKVHAFEPQAAPVVAMALSGRERSFATVGRDGAIVLRHQTSERVLAALPPAGPVSAVIITPKADGLLTLGTGVLQRYALDNPHPETSWKTLFGKVWY